MQIKKILAYISALTICCGINSTPQIVDTLTSIVVSAEDEEYQYSGSYDESNIPEVQTILDTAELNPHDTIYCYDCSSDMNSTDIMYTYKITENDKQILQNFIDENFTDDMCNTEKIQYTIDWLHNNITYTLSQDYFKLPNSLAECGFVEKAGQCLQYNGALAYMLAYMGYDTNLIFLKSGSWQHFTCQVRIDGKVYRMETGNKGLDDGSHYMYEQFLDLETEITPNDDTIIGQCGESVTYSFDKSTGILTISGIGDMYYNYWEVYNSETGEFESFQQDITSVIIENGITNISSETFINCTSLMEVNIPISVNSIGDYAFGYYYDWENYEYIKLENFTIYGATNSIAEKYALKNDFNFVSTGEYVVPEIEKPNLTDILNLKKYILGISTDGTDLDFNFDDSINILDLIIALNNLIK